MSVALLNLWCERFQFIRIHKNYIKHNFIHCAPTNLVVELVVVTFSVAFNSQRLELMRMVYNEEVSEMNSPEEGLTTPPLLRCIPNYSLTTSRFSLGNLLPSRLVPL